MVIFATITNPENETLKELVKEFNDKLENNDKYLSGKVWFKGNILIFQLTNYISYFDLPRYLTYKSIQIKWKRKGYKDKFKLLSNQKLLEELTQ